MEINIAELPKYESYKDAKTLWIDKIPTTWRLEKAKWLFKRADRPVRNSDEIVTCFRDGTVTLRSNRRTEGFTNALKEHGYQGIRKGDLVIHAMDAFAGAIGVSDSDGKATPVYAACVPKRENEVNSRFYAYYLRDMALSGFIASLAKGIRERSTDFRFNDFAELLLPIPDIEEQILVVNFLDKKISQIDEAIVIKEQQVALLKERKQIIIQKAVTQGLDPNVPMKDSGVDWIGKIPEHWGITRLKFESKIQSGITLGKNYRSENLLEVPYLRVANVQFGYFKLDDVATISIPKVEVGRYLLENKDILVTEGGDIDKLGRGTIWNSEISPCLHQNHVFAIRIDVNKLRHEFVSNYLGCSSSRKHFIATATKTTNLASTNRTHLGNLYLPVPSMIEQDEINAFIERQSESIESAVDIQQQQIEKLKEYKATLINSAVTGKIKVTPEMAGVDKEEPRL